MIKKPPCPPNCERRKPACQGHCPDFKIYRDELDEENRIIRAAKESKRSWTQSRKNALRKNEKFERKLARGAVHNK